ncbi:MAG: ABC transporter substrate-binding protein [Spirochaetales bacterium]|jgi:branched-chain amino acid transport system substrate-binding protein|nr:ABC transporter substrate-binding protein [Spirochaetales bacterium]
MKKCVRVMIFFVCAFLTGGLFAAGKAESREAVIGVIGPMTGPGAQSGNTLRDATALAVDELNARLSGITLKMVVVDDEGNPTRAISGNTRLVYNENALAVIGAVQSSCTLANMEITQEAGVAQITSMSTSPAITQRGNKWIFRTAATDAVQAENIVRIAVEKLGKKRPAVLYVSNDYGQDGYKVVLDVSTKLGCPPVVAETFNQGDLDYSSQLMKVKEAAPDVLIIWSMYEEAALIAKQAAAAGMQVQIMGSGGLTNNKYVELGGPATEGTIMCQTYHPSSTEPRVAEFTRRFKEKFNREPDPNAAQTYDAVMLLGAAIEKAGADRAGVRDALAGTKDYPGVTGIISFDSTGDSPRDMLVIQIRGGEYVLFE